MTSLLMLVLALVGAVCVHTVDGGPVYVDFYTSNNCTVGTLNTTLELTTSKQPNCEGCFDHCGKPVLQSCMQMHATCNNIHNTTYILPSSLTHWRQRAFYLAIISTNRVWSCCISFPMSSHTLALSQSQSQSQSLPPFLDIFLSGQPSTARSFILRGDNSKRVAVNGNCIGRFGYNGGWTDASLGGACLHAIINNPTPWIQYIDCPLTTAASITFMCCACVHFLSHSCFPLLPLYT